MNEKNNGFSAGYNQGMRISSTFYTLVLAPDCLITPKDIYILIQKLSLYKRRHPISFKQKGIVFNKKESTEKFINTKVKEKDDMEIKNLNKYFEILISDNYKKSKKSWVISAKNAIDNLHTYNGIAKEILVEFALEHIFDTYSARDKLELLNEFEVIKTNKDKEYSDAFIRIFQKTIEDILCKKD